MSEAAPLSSPDPRNNADAPLDLLLPLRSAGSLENPYPVYSPCAASAP